MGLLCDHSSSCMLLIYASNCMFLTYAIFMIYTAVSYKVYFKETETYQSNAMFRPPNINKITLKGYF